MAEEEEWGADELLSRGESGRGFGRTMELLANTGDFVTGYLGGSETAGKCDECEGVAKAGVFLKQDGTDLGGGGETQSSLAVAGISGGLQTRRAAIPAPIASGDDNLNLD